MTAELSSGTMHAKENGVSSLKVLKVKNIFKPRILCQEKISFKNEHEIMAVRYIKS